MTRLLAVERRLVSSPVTSDSGIDIYIVVILLFDFICLCFTVDGELVKFLEYFVMDQNGSFQTTRQERK